MAGNVHLIDPYFWHLLILLGSFCQALLDPLSACEIDLSLSCLVPEIIELKLANVDIKLGNKMLDLTRLFMMLHQLIANLDLVNSFSLFIDPVDSLFLT